MYKQFKWFPQFFQVIYGGMKWDKLSFAFCWEKTNPGGMTGIADEVEVW